jgi:coenzyme F420-0:L-glutamate ligase/coenzyme F420-1:gamma-L-glutamate ligase
LVVEHRRGHILANAGIDTSNIDRQSDSVLLWPEDPDASAAALAAAVDEAFGVAIPVIISDSIGRAWRLGTVGHAIGVSGMDPLWNQVGASDLFDNRLRVTEPATADAIAAAAGLVQGEAAEAQPVVWVRGCALGPGPDRTSRALLRPQSADMFR